MAEKLNFVFLHGGGQGGWVWRETLQALGERAGEDLGKILALDVPGCGAKRSRSVEKMTFPALIDELIADIDAAGIHSNVVLVGHSQAGSVMPYMLQRKPALFRRLIYISCSIPLPGQTLIEMVGGGLRGTDDSMVGWPVDPQTTSMQERMVIMFCNDMDEGQTKSFMSLLGKDQWPACSYTETNWLFEPVETVPATYVICSRDNILPVVWQEKFARRFHAKRVLRIDAGHQVMSTQPETLVKELLQEAME